MNQNSGGVAVVWGDDTFSACGGCAVCEPHVAANQDVSNIAGMPGEQRTKLRATGIQSISSLALADDKPENLNAKTFEKIRTQAKLQVKTLMLGADPETAIFLNREDSRGLKTIAVTIQIHTVFGIVAIKQLSRLKLI